ncbi:sterol carrier family protein [Pseudolysinimonas sp.]|jgi:hypothetical protein
MSIRRRIAPDEGRVAVRAVLAGADDRPTVALASRFLLEQLAEEAEGHTVEVRVPPFGAVQAVEGPRHTRGTPPNVVEMDAATWIAIATGRETWDAALADLRITASGQRATLAENLPLRWGTMEA